MAERIQLTEEQGTELYEAERGDIDGEVYYCIAERLNIQPHRWADTAWYIFKRESDGKLFALAYDHAATEAQESGFVYSRPELFEVTPVEVTVTNYEEAK